MEEPAWAKVLQTLYWEQEEMYREMKGSLPEDHKLVTKSDSNPDTVEDALLFLRKQDLIEQQGAGHERTESCELCPTHIEYTLTKKGFDVAHERELHKRQQQLIERQNNISDQQASLIEDQSESSKLVATFTVILAATALVNALTSIVSVPEYSSYLSGIYILLLLALWYKSDEWLLAGN